MDGIPWFDEELQMAQSKAHRDTIFYLCAVFDSIAEQAGLGGVSDYPIWYWIPEAGKQRVLYPDYALATTQDIKALTAHDLLLGLEVVSTARADKERKDSVQMRERSEVNQIPEFILVYPEPDDSRVLRWYVYAPTDGVYRELAPGADGRYHSQSVPGLEIEVLNPADWTPGQKVRIYYLGKEMFGFRDTKRQAEEAALSAEASQRQAEEAERSAAEERRARAISEQRAEHYLALLKQAGIEP
jgi:hypothetical protein